MRKFLSPSQKAEMFDSFIKGEAFYGKKMIIQEFLSLNGENFDRHFTTWACSEFILQKIGGRISGGRIIWEGEKSYYEVCADIVVNFLQKSEMEMEFLEKYSETVFRKTIIRFE
jgi:hypothetical protein